MDGWMERWMEAGCLTQGQWRGMKIVRPRERKTIEGRTWMQKTTGHKEGKRQWKETCEDYMPFGQYYWYYFMSGHGAVNKGFMFV